MNEKMKEMCATKQWSINKEAGLNKWPVFHIWQLHVFLKKKQHMGPTGPT